MVGLPFGLPTGEGESAAWLVGLPPGLPTNDGAEEAGGAAWLAGLPPVFPPLLPEQEPGLLGKKCWVSVLTPMGGARHVPPVGSRLATVRVM